jgi:hypothetical protein
MIRPPWAADGVKGNANTLLADGVPGNPVIYPFVRAARRRRKTA